MTVRVPRDRPRPPGAHRHPRALPTALAHPPAAPSTRETGGGRGPSDAVGPPTNGRSLPTRTVHRRTPSRVRDCPRVNNGGSNAHDAVSLTEASASPEHSTQCQPQSQPPGGSLCYCKCAQEAISTKSAGRKWLVSGLKDHRYLSVTKSATRRQPVGGTPTSVQE